MTTLLIALVGALAFSTWVTRIALSEAREAHRDAKEANSDAKIAHDRSVELAGFVVKQEHELIALRTQHRALLKRQQNRRDAAVQPLTGAPE